MNKNTVVLPEFGMPQALEIEPIEDCNFRCVMCHVSHMELSKRMLNIDFLNNMPTMEGIHVRVGASFEPTMHPKFDEIIHGLSSLGMKISLTTNGSLFTKSLIAKVKNGNFHHVTFSFDTANKENYEAIRRNGDYNRVVERFLNFKDSLSKETTYFSINTTILKQNMEDLLQTVEFAEKNTFNSLGLIAAVQRGNDLLAEEDFVYKHLKRYKEVILDTAIKMIERKYMLSIASIVIMESELEKKYPDNIQGRRVVNNKDIQHPPNKIEQCQHGVISGMPVACKSPFTFAKILFNGDVQLCDRFYIGNVERRKFQDIWFSNEAQYVRRQVIMNKDHCYSCDFFKFCINGSSIQYDDESSQKNNQAPTKILTKAEKISKYENYNIFVWLDEYYAVRMDDTVDYKEESHLLLSKDNQKMKNSNLEDLLKRLENA